MKRQTMVQLTDSLVDLLDKRARQEGVSRSHVIRDAVEAYLLADREAELDRRIIEGYRRIPPGTPDEWGDPEAFSNAHAGDNLRALAEEEQAAGAAPW